MVNNGVPRTITYTLQDRCLSRVCPSYNKHSELDLWKRGWLDVHWSDGGWESTGLPAVRVVLSVTQSSHNRVTYECTSRGLQSDETSLIPLSCDFGGDVGRLNNTCHLLGWSSVLGYGKAGDRPRFLLYLSTPAVTRPCRLTTHCPVDSILHLSLHSPQLLGLVLYEGRPMRRVHIYPSPAMGARLARPPPSGPPRAPSACTCPYRRISTLKALICEFYSGPAPRVRVTCTSGRRPGGSSGCARHVVQIQVALAWYTSRWAAYLNIDGGRIQDVGDGSQVSGTLSCCSLRPKRSICDTTQRHHTHDPLQRRIPSTFCAYWDPPHSRCMHVPCHWRIFI